MSSTAKLSRPQIDALRYAKGRMIYAADIGGNGNGRRTLLSLFRIGFLAAILSITRASC